MQTFLPEMGFRKSAEKLDYKRLGKQRVEAYQILLALNDEWVWSIYKGKSEKDNYGWKNHPVVKMWADYKMPLRFYYNCCIEEWISRGYKNTMPLSEINPTYLGKPIWYTEKFVQNHRKLLLLKDFEFYSRYDWSLND